MHTLQQKQLSTLVLSTFFGEVSTTAYVDINRVVRDTITEIGYNNAEYGFAAESVGVHPSLIEQSPDIAQGVNESLGSSWNW